jgi:integrase/recombinase XerC
MPVHFLMPIPQQSAIQAFIDHLRYEKRYSPHTVRAYGDDLTSFFDYLFLQYAITDVSVVMPFHVRSWLASMTEAGVKGRTVNRKMSCLKSFFRYGRRVGTVVHDPLIDIRVLKTSKRLPSCIGEDQMRVLLHDVEFSEGVTGVLERLVIQVFYETGVRVSELTGLREVDVDMHSYTLKVLGKGGKERLLPLSDALTAEVSQFIMEKRKGMEGSSQGFLFEFQDGRRLEPRKAYGIVRKYLSMVTTADKKGPHVLRHSFATHLSNHGADLNAIKELLGHSSLAATQVYTHNTISKLREAHRKAHPRG